MIEAVLFAFAAVVVLAALAYGVVGLMHAPRPKKKRRQKK